MTRLTLGPQLRAKLNGLNEHLAICDEMGQIVGHYLPGDLYVRLLYDSIDARVTDEELRQADEEPGGRSLAEIAKSLGWQ